MNFSYFKAHRTYWLDLNPTNAEAALSEHKNGKIFEKHLNPVMLVFIR